MTIKVDAVRGLLPRSDNYGDVAGFANEARNADLSSGYARPWCEPMSVGEAPDPCKTSVHIKDGRFRVADSATRFVDGEVCGNVYASNPCSCPQYYKDWCSDDEPRFLGVPKPDAPTFVAPDVVPTDLTDYVAYTIVYCNRDCPEEPVGPASQPSKQFKCNKDSSVTVTIPAPDPNSKYDVTHVKLYRLVTTWDAAQGMHEPGTDGFVGNNIFGGLETAVDSVCLLVDTIPIGNTPITYIDDCTLPCGESLILADSRPPPEGLCLAGETVRGSMVGFKDDCLLFSERHNYHAWPTVGYMTLGGDIDAVCVFRDRVFVLLCNGWLYMVEDDVTGVETAECRTVTKVRKTLRTAGGKNMNHKQTFCDHTGFTWITDQGIMKATFDGGVVNTTYPWFGYQEWLQTVPSKMTMAKYRGSTFFSSPCFSGVLENNVDGDQPRTEQIGNLSTLSICPDCWYTDCDGRLYFISCGVLWEFNAGSKNMQMCYETGLIKRYGMYSVASVNFTEGDRCYDTASGGTLCVTADGKPIDTKCTKNRRAFRFARTRAHEIRLKYTGNQPIRGMCLAASLTGIPQ